jgi:hypothetical protein
VPIRLCWQVTPTATITGGNSDNRAGGILNAATLTLNNSTVHDNETTNWGGGIYNLGGTLTVNNSTISGNSGGTGGIDLSGGMVTINNSTLTGNTATGGSGGGVYVFNGTMNLNRTIISGNGGGEIASGGGTINANNLNVFGHSGLTNAQAFTNFMPGINDRTATSNGTHPTALAGILNTTLADNGGPTLTHALVSSSPAIEIIPTTDANCNPGETADQRGAARANGPDAGGNACDAGAFEFGSNVTPTAVTLASIHASSAAPGGVVTAVAASLLTLLSGAWLWLHSRAGIGRSDP